MLVTRGDVDLAPILETLPYGEIVIWDNSKRPDDLGVYGRYEAIFETTKPVIYFQDDDCIVRCHDELVAHYRPEEIVANMPRWRWDDYPDSALLGWGCLLDRHTPFLAFARYLEQFPDCPLWRRRCDLVVAMLTPCTKYDFGLEQLPYASAPYRNYHQPGHYEERAELVEKIRMGMK